MRQQVACHPADVSRLFIHPTRTVYQKPKQYNMLINFFGIGTNLASDRHDDSNGCPFSQNSKKSREDKMDILIVEDDRTVGKLLLNSIQKWGHHSDLALTGEDALKQTHRNIYDLILLDVVLPDGPSYEKIPALKAAKPDVNIITMTGYNTPEMEQTVRGFGITYYMSKPININELKHIIDHLSKKRETEVNL